ncbi:MAG: Trk system potassium transporter TrkA [Phycisphaerae bacterium]
MNIVIAGAGEVGSHAAEVLVADGHNVVVIDKSASKLSALEDRLDVRTLKGNGAHAATLKEAGAGKADLAVAATNVDEINLLSASVAKGIGARKTIARVHHSAYFNHDHLDYGAHLGIDRLVCPEYQASLAIARTLRNPGALAVEAFARGRIEMQELPVENGAGAIGTSLADLKLPAGVRLAQIRRKEHGLFPTAATVIENGDVVTLIGEQSAFEQGRSLFAGGKTKRRHLVIMGGSATAVWLCRALESRQFSIRLFVRARERAEELSNKLAHVTVLQADVSEPDVFKEEQIGLADTFIAASDDDEHNILASAQAKSLGVTTAIALVQKTAYLHLLAGVGIDKAFSPRVVAANEIRTLLHHGPVRVMASLSKGTVDVYEINPTRRATAIGKELRNLKLPDHCMIGAIQRGETVRVPGAEDTIALDDTILLIGPHGIAADLKKIFATR